MSAMWGLSEAWRRGRGLGRATSPGPSSLGGSVQPPPSLRPGEQGRKLPETGASIPEDHLLGATIPVIVTTCWSHYRTSPIP